MTHYFLIVYGHDQDIKNLKAKLTKKHYSNNGRRGRINLRKVEFWDVTFNDHLESVVMPDLIKDCYNTIFQTVFPNWVYSMFKIFGKMTPLYKFKHISEKQQELARIKQFITSKTPKQKWGYASYMIMGRKDSKYEAPYLESEERR